MLPYFQTFRFSRTLIWLAVATVLVLGFALSPLPALLPFNDRLLFLAALAVMAGYWVDRSLARHVGAYRLRPDRASLQLLYALTTVSALMFFMRLWT